MSDVFLFDSYYNNLPQVGAPYCMVMAANFVCHCFAGDEHSFLFINELCDESFSRCVRVRYAFSAKYIWPICKSLKQFVD